MAASPAGVSAAASSSLASSSAKTQPAARSTVTIRARDSGPGDEAVDPGGGAVDPGGGATAGVGPDGTGDDNDMGTFRNAGGRPSVAYAGRTARPYGGSTRPDLAVMGLTSLIGPLLVRQPYRGRRRAPSVEVRPVSRVASMDLTVSRSAQRCRRR
jgi:hypothetical protein